VGGADLAGAARRAGAAALAPAQPKEVVFLGFGGTHEKNLREHAIPAFEKQCGIKVI
jgi:spermidine/putrescine-binding protein